MHPELAIAWVPGDTPALTRFRGLAPKHYTTSAFTDEFALITAIARGEVAVTIVEAGGFDHQRAVRTARRIRDAFPQHPLIAWCDLGRISTRELLDLANAGVQDVLRSDLDELRAVVSSALATATQRAAAARISKALHGVVPRTLRPVFEYALEHAHEHLDRETVAAGFGVSLRTLHGRLMASGLPSTRQFLTWCRLLVASALLEQPGQTLDSVAGLLDFHEGGPLGNAFRRYTGVGVSRLRQGNIFDATVAAFRAAVKRPQDTVGAVSADNRAGGSEPENRTERATTRPSQRDSLPEPSSAD